MAPSKYYYIMDEKIPSFFRFEDLRVYGKAVDYNRWLIGALGDANSESEKCLCRSFVQSAMDIAVNIVEGSSRSKSQFDHYLKIAKSAIRECVIYSALANGIGLLSDEACEQSRELLMELTRMIGALIISLQRGSRRSREADYNGPSMQDDTEDATTDNDFDGTFDEIN